MAPYTETYDPVERKFRPLNLETQAAAGLPDLRIRRRGDHPPYVFTPRSYTEASLLEYGADRSVYIGLIFYERSDSGPLFVTTQIGSELLVFPKRNYFASRMMPPDPDALDTGRALSIIPSDRTTFVVEPVRSRFTAINFGGVWLMRDDCISELTGQSSSPVFLPAPFSIIPRPYWLTGEQENSSYQATPGGVLLVSGLITPERQKVIETFISDPESGPQQ